MGSEQHDTGMKQFFATFGVGGVFGRKFVRITCDDMGEARGFMFEIFGKEWAFMYTADEFSPQPEQFGLTELCHLVKQYDGVARAA